MGYKDSLTTSILSADPNHRWRNLVRTGRHRRQEHPEAELGHAEPEPQWLLRERMHLHRPRAQSFHGFP